MLLVTLPVWVHVTFGDLCCSTSTHKFFFEKEQRFTFRPKFEKQRQEHSFTSFDTVYSEEPNLTVYASSVSVMLKSDLIPCRYSSFTIWNDLELHSNEYRIRSSSLFLWSSLIFKFSYRLNELFAYVSSIKFDRCSTASGSLMFLFKYFFSFWLWHSSLLSVLFPWVLRLDLKYMTHCSLHGCQFLSKYVMNSSLNCVSSEWYLL